MRRSPPFPAPTCATLLFESPNNRKPTTYMKPPNYNSIQIDYHFYKPLMKKKTMHLYNEAINQVTAFYKAIENLHLNLKTS